MTEYDYSPEAYERHANKMAGIRDWAADTARATSPTSSSRSSSSPPSRTSPTGYSKPRGFPVVQPSPVIPMPMQPRPVIPGQPISPAIPMHIAQPYPEPIQIRPSTADPHHHSHRHSSSRHRSRDESHGHGHGHSHSHGHTRTRSNSTSTSRPPSRSRTYSYVISPPPPAPSPYAPGQPQRGSTFPGYTPQTRYVTYDPSKPLIIPSGGPVHYTHAAPLPQPQARQPPLLKRLFTSMLRPGSRPQSAHPEPRSPVGVPSYGHARVASRDSSGRALRRRRSSLP